MTGRISQKRRESIFGTATLVAGFAITNLCLMPLFFSESVPHSLFRSLLEERFFFDMFGFISGFWLLSWVSSLNEWWGLSKIGQWLGIIALCVDQAIFVQIWRYLFTMKSDLYISGVWIAPFLLQCYMVGCFFGFFTLPSLTRSGNKTLTGLATLVLLLPWLFARDQIVLGTQFLNGLYVN